MWREALDWLYDVAMQRPTDPSLYPEMRASFYGPSGGPAPAPQRGRPSSEVLAEFRERVAPYMFNVAAPRLVQLLHAAAAARCRSPARCSAQWINQSVDVWVAGPVGALRRGGGHRWLRELVGSARSSWGCSPPAA